MNFQNNEMLKDYMSYQNEKKIENCTQKRFSPMKTKFISPQESIYFSVRTFFFIRNCQVLKYRNKGFI